MIDRDSTNLINNRYILNTEIGSGGMGIVYQATDKLTAQTVALKRVNIPSHQLDFSSRDHSTNLRVALAHEFQLLSSLRHPFIISVLDYGFDETSQPFIVLELLKNAAPMTAYAKNKSLEQKTQLLIQLLQTLVYLHRRGVIHRDLKPDNVLVTDDKVRVLDFGLAILSHYIDPNDEDVVGTIPYLAPEILRAEQPHSVTSDLFAVGIMAYELFSGQYPFEFNSIVDLIMKIANEEPDYDILDIPEELLIVIQTLMSKEPYARYQSATEVLELLDGIVGNVRLSETIDIRESYLQSASLIGRTEELTRLKKALDNVLADKGGGVLVGGESGIGKSRLVEEIRIQAMTQNTLVLTGQAVSEGGAPYQLWRDVLRRLVIQSQISDDDLNFLAYLLPNIGNLLQRPITTTNLTEYEDQVFQNKLIELVENLFRQQDQSIVLILEDLQWAGESLQIIRALSELTLNIPLLIIATYRDDERPDIPDELPRMEVLRLHRLSYDEISDLSQSILGDAGNDEKLIHLLETETEGNVFFIVEVIRALAEEAGTLGQISGSNLPETVVAGGMQAVLQRRINRIVGEARAILDLAALIGREIDLTLLAHIRQDINMAEWLLQVDTILEVQNDRWRFSHDKLRENILAEIPPEQKKAHHRRIAEAIEAVYPNDPDQYALLAFHWNNVGDTAKIWKYSVLAGEQAYRISAYKETIPLLERAIEVHPQDVDPLVLSQIYRYLGESYIGIGETMKGCRVVEKASNVLGYPLLDGDATVARMAIDIIWQLFVQLLIRIGLYRPSAKADEIPALQATLALDEPLTRGYRVSNTDPLLLFSANLRLANRAEKLPNSPHLAQAMTLLGVIFSSTPLLPLARYYIDRGTGMLDYIEASYPRLVIWRTRGFYLCNIGECKEGLHDGDIGLQISLETQKWREAEEIMLINASAAYVMGQLERTNKYLDDLDQLARRIGDNVFIGYLNIGRLHDLAWANDIFSYQDHIEFTRPYIRDSDIQSYYQFRIHDGIFAYLMGDIEEAISIFTEVLDYCDDLDAYLFMHVTAIVYMARVVYILLEEMPDDETRKIMAKRMLKRLQAFREVCRIADSAVELYRGVSKRIEGDHIKAEKHLTKSLEIAQSREFPYDEARAYHELALLDDATNDDEYLNKAKAIYQTLGMEWEVFQTEEIRNS